jgi:hypothetical protein
MRLALAVSVLGHGTIVAAALVVLANPLPMDAAPTPTISVDLVPEADMAAKESKTDAAAAPAANASPSQQPEQAAATSPAAPLPQPQPNPADTPASPMAATALAIAPQSPPPDAPTTAGLYIPLLPGVDHLGGDFGFDAPAETNVKLSRDEVAAFRAHLQKCWAPAGDMTSASQLQAVVRIAMTPQGALLREPLLISASASADGPKLVAAAMRALRQCQPFSFLPADKYQEWKVLDLSFSPRGLAGG